MPTDHALDSLPADATHLFVYGTLRSDSPHRSTIRLDDMAEFVGRGTACGLLYHVGATYPGAIFRESAGTLIHGEVWRLHDQDTAFKILDRYEEAAPLFPEAEAEYVRRLVPITPKDTSRNNGFPLHAWAYEYQSALLHPETPLIESGDFVLHGK